MNIFGKINYRRLADAMTLSELAHRGQTDKAGHGYFDSHVLDVMCRVIEIVDSWDVSLAQLANDIIVTSLLHDVVEDTSVTVREIEVQFGSTVATAVDRLSRKPGQTNDDYYALVKSDPVARMVKIADIWSNSDEKRLALLDDKTAERLRRKYSKALEVIG